MQSISTQSHRDPPTSNNARLMTSCDDTLIDSTGTATMKTGTKNTTGYSKAWQLKAQTHLRIWKLRLHDPRKHDLQGPAGPTVC